MKRKCLKNVPEIMKDMKTQIEEILKIPRKIKIRKTTVICIRVKLLKP